jgi:hypothetical protein
MASRKSMPTLSDEQLGELLGLIEGADSVELKLTVPESDHHAAAGVLGLDPLDAQMRQVYFFDTPDLTLSKAGVVVRARRVQGKGDDSVVKLRPVEPDQLPRKLRKARGFGVEVDAMPGGFVCSGSMKSPARADVRETVTSAHSPRTLFSKDQQAFFAEYAPDGIGLDDLSILGPIFVLKLKFRPEELKRRLVAEMWLYPDNSRILELSTKCAPAESFLAAAQVRAFLSERGVDLSGEQETKTRKALEFFSKRLRAGA